jgi:hypothetical protein
MDPVNAEREFTVKDFNHSVLEELNLITKA